MSSSQSDSQGKIKALISKFSELNSGLTNPTARDYEANFYRAFASQLLDQLDHPACVELCVCAAMESDRGCVLIAASLMDNELESLLRRKFSTESADVAKVVDSLFSASRDQDIPPLQSTMLKIKLAYALGLIDEWLKKACVKLQRMRSTVFAHSPSVRFLSHDDAIAILRCFPDLISDRPPGEEGVEKIDLAKTSPKELLAAASMMVITAIASAGK